jgi:hypothetical protein
LRDSIVKFIYVDTPGTTPKPNFFAARRKIGIGEFSTLIDISIRVPPTSAGPDTQYLPIFRPETEIFAGNTMQKFVQTTVAPPFTLGPTGIVGNTGVEAGFGASADTGGATAPLTTDQNSNATRITRIDSAIPSDDTQPWPKSSDPQGPFNA